MQTFENGLGRSVGDKAAQSVGFRQSAFRGGQTGGLDEGFAQQEVEAGGQGGQPGNAVATHLGRIANLTPGDFANVRRQATLLDLTLTADELLNRLKQECRSKSNGGNRPAGFIHPA